MSKKVKIILITLVVLVLTLGIVLGALGIWYHTTRRPYEMFEQVFGFELPETADILRWTIPKNNTWDIAAKISVQEEDLPIWKQISMCSCPNAVNLRLIDYHTCLLILGGGILTKVTNYYTVGAL